MDTTLKILITGPIGSGKSTACRYINEMYGIPVYYSDAKAKKCYTTDVLNEIESNFGLKITTETGELDKKALANIIFNDDEKKAIVESIIHPRVRQDFLSWTSRVKTPYVIMESALMNNPDDFNLIIMVDAPENIRLERATHRDNVSKEKICERLKCQKFDKSLVNYTINSGYSLEDFYAQIDVLFDGLIHKPKNALFAGSFDPFTNGHLSIVNEASKVFDFVYVVLSKNDAKKRVFDINDMKKAIEETLISSKIFNCKVLINENMLTAKLCKKLNVDYLIRGLRSTQDYIYEENIENFNYVVNQNLKTVYFRGAHEVRGVSSSLVRELMRYNNEGWKNLIPTPVYETIRWHMQNSAQKKAREYLWPFPYFKMIIFHTQ